MTDEEKAKEWVRTNSGYSTKEFHGQKAIEAYLAGAEFGYNKAFVEADKNLKAIVTDYNKANERLTKAKELLAKWVELFKPKGGNIPPTPIQAETEQFLKEIKQND